MEIGEFEFEQWIVVMVVVTIAIGEVAPRDLYPIARLFTCSMHL